MCDLQSFRSVGLSPVQARSTCGSIGESDASGVLKHSIM